MEFFKATVDSVQREEVKIGDTKDTFIQWLVTKAQGSESYALRRFTMKPGGVITCHNHKYVETVYLLQGKLEVSVGNQKLQMEKDSYVFINKFVPHELKNIGNEEVVFLCVISYEDDMKIKALDKCPED
ncbi:cupin domain-containing protein [Sulfuracidifex tepidarius]|uniref:Cupin type-2 domain-containing protein n=1 Tax=Sulfuracidifex tepidarius TaxID=1294262 RepID=A0A510DRG2_9CREN|nr:cupin domain-containing protein [Sulfuracidifex tepidarius]BBG22742.1 hypothetical protein IC006_0026 [Sulfuracidifex tepidarius]BBG25521.1 hypothetical protein IC007_0026 [Sulfuracidifex tepidarius]